MNYIQQVLVCGSGGPAPLGFGLHPEYARSLKQQPTLNEAGKLIPLQRSVEQLRDPRHPEIILIPRAKNCDWVDSWGDNIGIERIPLHCSSYDFYVDREKEGLFEELLQEPALWRLGGLNQLGYLTPPKPNYLKNSIISYVVPLFHHNRLLHSQLVAFMGYVLLSRNGFTPEEIAPLVLAFYSHDSAMPGGGESVKRIDKKALCEEANYAYYIQKNGLDKKWQLYGYKLAQAAALVGNKGLWGLLLDILDKISYVAIDCYMLGLHYPGKVRSLLTRHPLLFDIWQDIRFTPDKQHFYFCDVDRLFRFLLLRAYEHQELLFNPLCRCWDFFFTEKVAPLYQQGIITKDMLLEHDDAWLESVLEKHYPGQIERIVCPDELGWEKFKTKKEAAKFSAGLGQQLSHCEQIKGFDTGLQFPALHKGQIVPIENALSPARVRYLESIRKSTQGHYVYYKK